MRELLGAAARGATSTSSRSASTCGPRARTCRSWSTSRPEVFERAPRVRGGASASATSSPGPFVRSSYRAEEALHARGARIAPRHAGEGRARRRADVEPGRRVPRAGGRRRSPASLSGLLFALAFPPFGWVLLLPLALVPWLVALARRGERGVGRSCSGVLFGLAYWCASIPWIFYVVTHYGGQPGPMGVVCLVILARDPGASGPRSWLGRRGLRPRPVRVAARGVSRCSGWRRSTRAPSSTRAFPGTSRRTRSPATRSGCRRRRCGASYGVGALVGRGVAALAAPPRRPGAGGAVRGAAGRRSVAARSAAFGPGGSHGREDPAARASCRSPSSSRTSPRRAE